MKAGDADVTRDVPVQFRYVKDIYNGDKRMELNVVPAFSVRVDAAAGGDSGAGLTRGRKADQRESHVSVTNGTKGAAQASVTLDLPPGWKATPASAPLSFAHEDESLVGALSGHRASAGEDRRVYACMRSSRRRQPATRNSRAGYQEIEYPHVQRRQVIKPAEVELKVIDVKTAPEFASAISTASAIRCRRPSSNWARS